MGKKYSLKKKRHYCNNGVQNKYWYDDTGIPEGFVDGHLPMAEDVKAVKKLKTETTNLRKYGVRNTFNTPDVLEKSHSSDCIEVQKANRERTKLERYGDKNWSNNKQAMETNTKLYGGVLNGSEIIRVKSEITKEKKYGDKNYSNRDKAVITRAENGLGYCFRKYYYYDGLHFDSGWELYYYIYNKDNNNIKKCTTYFNYLFNNKNHTYTPDFIVDGKYVDVKGTQFLEGDKMINPYNREQDDLYEAKHQCMILNDVKMVLEDEINSCKQYVDQKYGQHYIDQFEVTK